MAKTTRVAFGQKSNAAWHDKLVGEIIVALSAQGLCRVWENPTGAAYRNGILIRYGLKGSADITGILKNGKRLEIEVKTGKAVQQENQKAFEKMIRIMGGFYFVAHSVEEALMQVESVAVNSNS